MGSILPSDVAIILAESHSTFISHDNMVSTVELMDRFQALLHLEATTYKFNNYLFGNRDKRFWRTKTCGWMYHLVDSHLLDRELVAIAMNYMDRHLDQARHLSEHSFITQTCYGYQLVGMTSLYMAIKIYRNQGKSAAVASFANVSRGMFTEYDFEKMEQCMLDTLKWRVHPPTPQSYLELLITLLPRGACSPFTRRALVERIKFLLELSVTVEYFFGKKSSNITVAAFLEVMENENQPNVSKQTYRSHFRHCARSIAGIDCDSHEVAECRDAMKVVHKNALHQMKDGVMNEREYTATPFAPENQVSAVTP